MVDDGDQVHASRFARQGTRHDDTFQIRVDAEAPDELSQIVIDDDNRLALHTIKHDVEIALCGIGIDDHVGARVVVDEEGALHITAFRVDPYFQCGCAR